VWTVRPSPGSDRDGYTEIGDPVDIQMRIEALALIGAVGFAGCSLERAQIANEAPNKMIGFEHGASARLHGRAHQASRDGGNGSMVLRLRQFRSGDHRQFRSGDHRQFRSGGQQDAW
jgi:hypothetical protein